MSMLLTYLSTWIQVLTIILFANVLLLYFRTWSAAPDFFIDYKILSHTQNCLEFPQNECISTDVHFKLSQKMVTFNQTKLIASLLLVIFLFTANNFKAAKVAAFKSKKLPQIYENCYFFSFWTLVGNQWKGKDNLSGTGSKYTLWDS